MYNLALIGCGYMGQSHLEELHLNPSVCLKGVCDLNIEAAKKTAMLFNAESYSADSSEYIENPDIDIIIIATFFFFCITISSYFNFIFINKRVSASVIRLLFFSMYLPSE